MGRRPCAPNCERACVTDKSLPTRLIHLASGKGRRTVNPPIERASTVVFDDEKGLYGPLPTYGRMGLGVHEELKEALCALENASYAQLAPSGLAACALAVASVVKAGDHVLIADTLYGPTRRFCERRLKAMGVSITRFPPRVGSGIADLVQADTTAIFLESPGSLTFELIDTPAIVAVAKDRGVTTILDNTWAAGVYHKPLDLGVDLSVHALTKYAVGHADGFGGAVMTTSRKHAKALTDCAADWGIALGPDDAYTALRGLRTLHTRLSAHETTGLKVAHWLAGQPWISEVLHPAFETHPDHAIWQRDFTGSCGLFGAVMVPTSAAELTESLAKLNLFKMGFSWGGFESLLIPCDEQLNRSSGDWTEAKPGPLLRLHIGLEDPVDLIADLDQAFAQTG